MRPIWWACLASAILVAIFSILTAIELGVTASGAGDGNPCSPTSNSGLLGDQTPAVRSHYAFWRIDHGEIGGFPPQRECSLYGAVSLDGPFRPIDSQRYPSLGGYFNTLLFALSPIFLVLLWRGIRRLTYLARADGYRAKR
jgi:hypothetical protein